ncbi:MAG: cobalamin-binding protein [Chloracidobacterium sp.]|nr:cobalamin-binding protein [Chloracidobacterium sp.]
MRREPPRQPKRLPPLLRKEGSLWIAVALTTLMLLSACGGAKNAGNSATPVPMRVVTDDLGRAVTIPVKVTRVVSLAPNLTENIFAVGAGDRLVGVTTFCNYPEQAKAIAKIGDTMTPNMESIIALKPDVVFVSTASQIEAFMKTLEANGIAVYVTNPTGTVDVMRNLKALGEIFDTQKVSDDLIANLTQRINAVANLTGPLASHRERPTKVFIQISKEPLFTIGNKSHLNEWLFNAGGQSVTENVDTAYPKLSKETASALNPEVIILSESDDNKEPNDAFKNSPAVKNGRVYKVNADLLSRPGPRLVDALEQIAKDLHPEKFK